MNDKESFINLLKEIKKEKIIENIEIVDINDNRELITKGVLLDDNHTCYHSYKDLDEIIISLITSANNYGIYLEGNFIGIIGVSYQYYKDLTRLELSIVLKEEYRNIGIGKHCLDLIICDYFYNSDIKSFHLSIREDNIKSRKMAEACGFKEYKGYKIDNTFNSIDGTKIPQVQYLLKRKDYIK